MSLLNTITSLVFIFLLYSLFATALQESLATMIQRRSKTLYDGIKTMLTNTPGRQLSVTSWIAYWLGIWWIMKRFGKNKDKPKDEEMRALSKRDSIITDSKQSEISLYRQFYDHPIVKNYGQSNLFSKPSYITDKNFSAILVDVIKNLVPENKIRTANFQMIQEAIDRNKQSTCLEKEVVEILQYHLNESGGDLDVFKGRLEQWYNDTMDRVSGWYKRNTQFYLLIIGIFLAVSFNVDTVEIGSLLSGNPVISEEVANVAIAMIEKDSSNDLTKPEFDSIKNKVLQTNTLLGLGWGEYGKKDPDFIKSLKEDEGWISRLFFFVVGDDQWADFKKDKNNIEIPDNTFKCYNTYVSLRYIAYRCTPSKLLGFFITTIAIGLGAPFWFDLLSKISTLRTAGKAINSATAGKKETETIDG